MNAADASLMSQAPLGSVALDYRTGVAENMETTPRGLITLVRFSDPLETSRIGATNRIRLSTTEYRYLKKCSEEELFMKNEIFRIILRTFWK